MKSRLHMVFAAFMVLSMVGVGFSTVPTPSQAQGDSRTFPETGKTVKGRFLAYWTANGGLAQQGFPISDEMQEVSDTDGKTYTVQYFERAVFELHPENQAPNDVLLSLLGVFLYNQKYPAGAPNQTANNEAGSQLFPETGKRVGGRFLEYWKANGGLAQQGFPISEEFNEVSDLNGQTYKVQYFQRAVFEYHPEIQDPKFQVLLSQLGTFQYRRKYLTPTATPTVAATNTPLPTNTAVPQPTRTTPPPAPTNTAVPSGPCAGVRESVNMLVAPNCARGGTRFLFIGRGFNANENVGIYITAPDGSVFGAEFQAQANGDGLVGPLFVDIGPAAPLGNFALTMEGVSSRKVAIGYFRIIAP